MFYEPFVYILVSLSQFIETFLFLVNFEVGPKLDNNFSTINLFHFYVSVSSRVYRPLFYARVRICCYCCGQYQSGKQFPSVILSTQVRVLCAVRLEPKSGTT
jgi:hypothetical protein